MDQAFIVQGINGSTGEAVELIIVAADAADAKRCAEKTGLQAVIASPAPDEGVSTVRSSG